MSGKTGDCGLADEKQELCHKNRQFGTLLNQCFAVYRWVLGLFAAPGWADRLFGRDAVVQHARLSGSKSRLAAIYLRVEAAGPGLEIPAKPAPTRVSPFDRLLQGDSSHDQVHRSDP